MESCSLSCATCSSHTHHFQYLYVLFVNILKSFLDWHVYFDINYRCFHQRRNHCFTVCKVQQLRRVGHRRVLLPHLLVNTTSSNSTAQSLPYSGVSGSSVFALTAGGSILLGMALFWYKNKQEALKNSRVFAAAGDRFRTLSTNSIHQLS